MLGKLCFLTVDLTSHGLSTCKGATIEAVKAAVQELQYISLGKLVSSCHCNCYDIEIVHTKK